MSKFGVRVVEVMRVVGVMGGDLHGQICTSYKLYL